MVVAYVDSVMSRLGRHLSIQAALKQWGPWPKVDRPHAAGLGAAHWPPAQTWPGPLAGSCPSAQGQAVTRHGQHSRGDRKRRLSLTWGTGGHWSADHSGTQRVQEVGVGLHKMKHPHR